MTGALPVCQEAQNCEDRAVVVVAVLRLAATRLAVRYFDRMANSLMVDVAEAEPKLERERQKRQPRPDLPTPPEPAHAPIRLKTQAKPKSRLPSRAIVTL
jgi:hypothetical protein